MAAFNPMLVETYTAPTNIAVIKYWGKNDLKLNTPMNSSSSITLDQGDLHTITSIAASKDLEEDRMWLNGDEIVINGRGKTCLAEIRKIAGDRKDANGNVIVAKEDWINYKVHIVSINTFPTGAGLASSAAGLACFVSTLAKLYNVSEEYEGHLTAIARQGSGSASRSMFGGFVEWQKGERSDAHDSIAIQRADENYWPEMRAVICVVSDKEKDTSSTSGMETSRKTSTLLAHRANNVVAGRINEMEKSYLAKDFDTFGKLTMQDSNQFHAVCMDTYPPIFYMNDISKTIIRLCTIINSYYSDPITGKGIKAAYTYDAGPNAVIYCLEKDAALIYSIMARYFPAPNSNSICDYTNNADYYNECTNNADNLIPADLANQLDKCGRVPASGDVKYMFYTKSGPGPIHQPIEEAILDTSTGLPIDVSHKHKRMRIS
jgi:diphosphomevalonate decarboxylase